jgi:hypothetical protein
MLSLTPSHPLNHPRRPARLLAFLTAATLTVLGSTPSLHAVSSVPDPLGDFLPSFTGPHNGDLDVLSTGGSFNGSTFTFSATLAGALGTTPGGFYVFGIDRGAGTARFGALATQVLFDAVVIARPDGTGTVNLLNPTASSLALPAGSVSISGDSFSVQVPLSFLPSNGFDPSVYAFNLWPRNGSGNNNQISDFAPDNAVLTVSRVPESGNTALLLVGALAPVLGAGWWRPRLG